MPQMTALRRIRYGGRSFDPGQVFDARDKDTRILAAIRSAALAPEADEAEPQGQEQRQPDDVAPAEVAEAPAAEEAPKPKRKYKRRDMTAE